MEPSNNDLALAQADEFAGRVRHAAQWLARYYVAFGFASLLFALGFGVLSGPAWMVALIVLWGAAIIAISLYAGRQRTLVRGGQRLHLTVMLVWSAVWVLTVAIGSSLDMPWPWWLGGGVLLFATCLVGARIVQHRAGARP